MYNLGELRRSLGLARKKPIPYPTQSIEMQEYIGQQYKDDYDRALFYMLYLGGQRISECLNTKRMDITTGSREGYEFIIIDSMTEKNRQIPRRTIPIPIQGKEKLMAETLLNFINNIPQERRIFDGLSRTNAWHRLSKVSIENRGIDVNNNTMEYNMKIFCHYQRHCRASHMVMFHGYDLIKLMQYFGWSSPAVPTIYVMLDWTTLAKPMMKDSEIN